ncbi:hypothetical protein MMC11_001018 [Xylographa trunciseda]|nr:hypothetical protein [Xylographa trunciseda]
MDGISAAASVTALITIALQSSSFIYKFLNAIHDGPEQIRILGRRVDKLHESLQQIANLLQLAESSDEDGSNNDGWQASKYLRSSLYTCANDLQGIQAKVSKLKVSKDNSVRKAWSAVKHVLGSKEFEHADKIISRNLDELNLQLNIIGRRSDVGYHKITRNIKHIAELGLAAATASLSEQRDQRSLLEAFREGLQKRHDLSDTATARTEGVTSALDAQISEITKRVREIQLQLSAKAIINTQETTSTTDPGSSEHGCFQKRDSQPSFEPDLSSKETFDRSSVAESRLKAKRALLDSAIGRLCHLASLKPGKVDTEEAECIIDDLETILTMIQEQDQLLEHSGSRGFKRKANVSDVLVSEELPHAPYRALKRLRRILTASQTVDLRQNSTRGKQAGRLKGNVSHNLTQHFKIEDNTVMISYISRAPPHSAQTRTERIFNESEDEVDSEQPTEIFEGNISVIVPRAPHATKFSVQFQQLVTIHGSSILNPGISFHCIRPLDSAIFHVAGSGTLVEFLALLQTPEASLNDCDEFGRSILNYALSKSNVSICRFLTKHNYADANAMEQVISDYPHRTSASLRLMLDVDPSIDLEDRDDQGRTALMLLFLHSLPVRRHTPQGEFYDMAITLLDHGADVNARDIYGRGCVHMVFDTSPRFHNFQSEKLKSPWKALVLLIDRGYDIYHTDSNGRSVCEGAIKSDLGWFWLTALRASKFHYKPSTILAEDHARYHQRKAADINHSTNTSHDGQRTPGAPESRRNDQETALTNLPFTECADRRCQWPVWRNIKILSTKTNLKGGGDIMDRWCTELRWHDSMIRKWSSHRRIHPVYEDDILIGYFNCEDEESCEDSYHKFSKAQNQQDMNDKAESSSEEWDEQSSTYSSDEDASTNPNTENDSPLHTTQSRAGATDNQQERSHHTSEPASPCSLMDDGTQASEDAASAAEVEIIGDVIREEQPAYLEPRHTYDADVHLHFNPWS